MIGDADKQTKTTTLFKYSIGTDLWMDSGILDKVWDLGKGPKPLKQYPRLRRGGGVSFSELAVDLLTIGQILL